MTGLDTYLTDFADEAVILPQVVAVAAGLMLGCHWWVLWAWLGVVGSVLGTIVVLKVGCYGLYGDIAQAARPSSPSGHCAAAAMMGGTIAAALARNMRAERDREIIAISMAVAISAAVGASRLHLGAHSVPDVVAGGLVGTLGAWLFAVLLRHSQDRPPRLSQLCGMVLPDLVFHGRHLTAEPMIRQISAIVFS